MIAWAIINEPASDKAIWFKKRYFKSLLLLIISAIATQPSGQTAFEEMSNTSTCLFFNERAICHNAGWISCFQVVKISLKITLEIISIVSNQQASYSKNCSE